MNITLEKYIKILNAGFSLDVLYLLKLIKDKVDITDAILLPKIQAINQTLLRKQLITDDNQVTVSGDDLLTYLEEEEESSAGLIKRLKTNDFDRWWMVYPSSNMFVYKNKTFKGTQSKKIKKPECKQLFNKYINEGFTADDIINATEYHFQVAKDLSFKEGKNQLSFIGNSYRYLNEKMFLPFIELYKEKSNKTSENINTIDI